MPEQRLIDANALIREIIESRYDYAGTPDEVTHHDIMCDNAVSWIDGAEIIDAVPVVRCSECKHWNEEIEWCNLHSCFITPNGDFCHPWESDNWKTFDKNDFCSYGEIKEGA